MKRDEVDVFEKLNSQLISLHSEMTLMSKKSPNDAVNKFKIKFINKTIKECNSFLGSKYKPYDDFDELSEDELPTNSDVTFIISQYIECAEKFRSDNIRSAPYKAYWVWITEDIDMGDTNSLSKGIETSPPRKLSGK